MAIPLEEDRERHRERLAFLTAHVVAERTAHRRVIDLLKLRVQPVVACVERIPVSADDVFAGIAETQALVAEDLRRGAVELDLLFDREERALNVEALVVNALSGKGPSARNRFELADVELVCRKKPLYLRPASTDSSGSRRSAP
jgi:hypothetical protein